MNWNMVKFGMGSAIVGVIVLVMLSFGLIGSNDNENYQIIQKLSGDMVVRDEAGIYLRGFAKVTTYPKSIQVFYDKEPDGGYNDDNDYIRATFNDGGIANVSSMIRFRMPTSEDKRLLAHREFSGNKANIVDAVRAHLLNAVKATATMMSATENQTSRKTEFAKVIEEQAKFGLYEMKRVEKSDLDFNNKERVDANGKPITMFATEVVCNPKTLQPIIGQESPLKQYDIDITQFSITAVDYDEATRNQFALKKDATLKTELAKVEVEKAKMETEKAVQEGLRTVAEAQAKANTEAAAQVIAKERDKKLAEIEAAQKVAVAEQATKQAEQEKAKSVVEAKKHLEVAEVAKRQAEVVANQQLEVAKIEKTAAVENAAAIVSLAEAQQKKITLAGSITEKERVLAEILANRDVGVADKLSGLKLPSQVVMTGGSTGGGADNLFNVMGVNATLDLMKKISTNTSEVK